MEEKTLYHIPKNYRRDIQIYGIPLRNLAEGGILSLASGALIKLLPIPSLTISSTLLVVVVLLVFVLSSKGVRHDSITQFLFAYAKFKINSRKLVYRRDFREPKK